MKNLYLEKILDYCISNDILYLYVLLIIWLILEGATCIVITILSQGEKRNIVISISTFISIAIFWKLYGYQEPPGGVWNMRVGLLIIYLLIYVLGIISTNKIWSWSLESSLNKETLNKLIIFMTILLVLIFSSLGIFYKFYM